VVAGRAPGRARPGLRPAAPGSFVGPEGREGGRSIGEYVAGEGRIHPGETGRRVEVQPRRAEAGSRRDRDRQRRTGRGQERVERGARRSETRDQDATGRGREGSPRVDRGGREGG